MRDVPISYRGINGFIGTSTNGEIPNSWINIPVINTYGGVSASGNVNVGSYSNGGYGGGNGRYNSQAVVYSSLANVSAVYVDGINTVTPSGIRMMFCIKY